MEILKIVLCLFFIIFYSFVFSQIEILKTISISGASYNSGLKDKNNNTYIGLIFSSGVNDSVLIENNFVTKSKGKIDPNNPTSRAYAFALIALDSNYNLTTFHQIYGNANVFSSNLFLASDSCIYFSISTLDTVYINEEPIFNSNPKGYNIILKYNTIKDTLTIIKKIFVDINSNTVVDKFKEFNGNLYFTLQSQGVLEISGQLFTSGFGQADMNLFILQLDRNNYDIIKWYLIEGDDQKVIRDYNFDQIGNLHVIGEFWGARIISNIDTITNTKGRSYDGFYFKIDSNKNVTIKKRIGGPSKQFPRKLRINKNETIDIFGYYNDNYIEVDQERLYNSSNGENIFSLKLDKYGNVLFLNQLNNSSPVIAFDFTSYNVNKDLYLASGIFINHLNIGSNQYLKTPNDKADAFILLMNENCEPIDGFQISGTDYESCTLVNNGNNLYTIWAYSGSDTTYFVNFDQKYRTGLGQFFMDIKIKSSTGILEIEKSLQNIEIYPNPISDIITIRSLDLNKINDMEIITIDGKNVYQKTIDFSSAEMRFQWPAELESGIYFIKFRSKNSIRVIKAVKQ